MGNVNTKITGDAQDLIREQKRVAEGAAEVTEEYRELLRESQQMGRVASQAWRDTRTNLEKYESRVKELNAALAKGKIDTDTHSRAMQLARQRYDEAEGSAEGFLTTLRSFAGVAASIGVGTSAVALFRAEFERVNQIAQEAGERLKSGRVARGNLAQVVEGDTLQEMQRDYAMLKQQSNLFRSEGGAESAEQADDIVFALRSTGFLQDSATYRTLGRTGLVGAGQMSEFLRAMDSIRDNFGQAEVGDSRQLISKLLAGSAITQVSAAEMGTAAAKTSGEFRLLGFTDEEAIAAVATTADQYTSPDTAADRMRALTNKLAAKGMSANTMEEMVGILTAYEKMHGSIRDIVGEDESANSAFQKMKQNIESGIYTQTLDKIIAENSGRQFDMKTQLLTLDDDQRPLAVAQGATGEVDISREAMGREEVLRQAIIDTQEAYDATAQKSGFERWFNNMINQTLTPALGADAALLDETYIAQERRDQVARGNSQAVALLDKMIALQEEIVMLQREANKKQDDSAKQQAKPKPAVPAPET